MEAVGPAGRSSPGSDGACAFYLPKKNRCCRFRPSCGNRYCAEHVFLLNEESSRKRIPCPLDPKHTCYEDKLEKHLKKCNSVKIILPPCYKAGVNSGCDQDKLTPATGSKVTICNTPSNELELLINKVNKLCQEYVKTIDLEQLYHPCLKDELENPMYGIQAQRQRKQQASLLGHLNQLKLLKDDICYIELGAGKGQLSHWVQKATSHCSNVSFVLVEKSHIRYKFDGQHRPEEKEQPKFERLHIDLQHLNLGLVPTVMEESRTVVGMGKHLCGVGTDFALRCLLQTLPSGSKDVDDEDGVDEKSRSRGAETTRKLEGIVLAPCCHHRCVWPAYVGQTFFHQCGLSEHDFQLISNMSSWATCCWKGWRGEATATRNGTTSSSPVDHTIEDHHPSAEMEKQNSERTYLKLPVEERETVGRWCKKLLDIGRVKYLQDQGLAAVLKEYIYPNLTPENSVILASSSPSMLLK